MAICYIIVLSFVKLYSIYYTTHVLNVLLNLKKKKLV